MSTFPSALDALALFAQCLKTVPDPRSKQGTSHPCSTLLAVVLLGLLTNLQSTCPLNISEGARWTKRHFSKLSKVLRFGRIERENKTPFYLSSPNAQPDVYAPFRSALSVQHRDGMMDNLTRIKTLLPNSRRRWVFRRSNRVRNVRRPIRWRRHRRCRLSPNPEDPPR